MPANPNAIIDPQPLGESSAASVETVVPRKQMNAARTFASLCRLARNSTSKPPSSRPANDPTSIVPPMAAPISASFQPKVRIMNGTRQNARPKLSVAASASAPNSG